MSVVECDRASLADGKEISIEEAISGSNGYFCLGCGHELMARKGRVNNPHFAHVPTGIEGERPCDYSSETYRHEQAKKLLRRLRKVRVPAVYAAYPPGYQGRVPRLADSQEVVAVSVLDERNIYVDEQGEVCFAKRYRNEPFDDQQGKLLLLARPDVLFLNEQGRPNLLIEIYATHKVNEEKLSRLRALGIDAIEIYIPRHCDPAAIEQLFSVTTHTHWLYNGQQTQFGPLGPDSHLLASGSTSAADLEDRLPGRAESLKCRRSRVGHALRAIRSCLGRVDIQDVQGAIIAAQATGETFIAGVEANRRRLEAQRDKRDKRLGATIQQRVAERRKALTAQERELAAQEESLGRAERELAERISATKARLRDLVTNLTQQIKRAESAAEDEFSDGMAAIRNERIRRRNQLSRFSREGTAITTAASRLKPDEAELAREEDILTRHAATTRRGLDYATAELRRIEQATASIEEQKVILRRIESEIA